MKKLLYLLFIVSFFSCRQSSIYSKIKEEQRVALLNYFNYSPNASLENNDSNISRVRLNKSRLRKSLKRIVDFIENKSPGINNIIIFEFNSLSSSTYEGLVFDLDRSIGYKFKYADKVWLFREEYDSEFRDYKSYIEQYLKSDCEKFHEVSKAHSPDDLHIPCSFITKINLVENVISSCAFNAYYWRIDSTLRGVPIFNDRVVD